MEKFVPTAEQIAALDAFKRDHGRKWRAELEHVFYRGWPSGAPLYSGELQRVRNTAGGIAWIFGKPNVRPKR